MKSLAPRLAYKGFTLIELMIVVAIIGILAAIAVPNFVKFQCRSKQSEAKTNLKSMYVAQESYRAEFDAYVAIATCGAIDTGGSQCGQTGKGAEIGWQPKGTKIRYNYTGALVAGDAEDLAGIGFEGDAAGTGDVVGDLWEINHRNVLTNSTNSCL